MTASPLDIQPLTSDRFADLAALFEEGGDAKSCWCTYFRFRGRDWTNSTAAETGPPWKASPGRIRRPACSPIAVTEWSAG